MRTLCYCVTGHGCKHAIRTVQILQSLPADVRLLVGTTVPAHVFADALPKGSLTVLPAEFDCGCVQSASVTVREAETLARYRVFAQQNNAALAEEVAFLRCENVQCVLTDIASFSLRAARAAGIPGIAIANFT